MGMQDPSMREDPSRTDSSKLSLLKFSRDFFNRAIPSLGGVR